MNNRVIGRLVLIKNSNIIAEVSNDIENYINTRDGIRFVGEIGSYVSIYELGRTLIAEVLSAESSYNSTNQLLAKPISNRLITLKLIGEIINEEFYFGVSKMPLLYSEVHIITNDELDIMLNVNDSEVKIDSGNTRITAFSLGESVLFNEYDVKVDVDKFFGYHSAIFGNTGSGKSNSIARIIQNIYTKKNFSATGSRLIIFDANGEYEQAFSKIESENNDIYCKFINPTSTDTAKELKIPIWLLSIDDWAVLLNASEKTQIPILRKSQEISKVFYSENGVESLNIKNHMLATTIIGLLNSSESSPSTSDKILALLTAFNTDNINLNSIVSPSSVTLKKAIEISYGKMDNVEKVIEYLTKYLESESMSSNIMKEDVHFSATDFLEAMKFAIMYEGSMNSQKIQEYTAPLVSRMQSLVESEFSEIFCKTTYENKEEFFKTIVGSYNLINIDISCLDDSMGEVLARVLSKIMLDYQKEHDNKAEQPINLFIEEAHRYIKENKQVSGSYDFDVFQRISKEGRKYGLLLCVSTQRPSDLSKTVVSQCSNFIIHRIQNPDDLNYIGRMVPYIDKNTIDRLTYLQTGNALVFGSSIRIPMLTKFEEAQPNTDGKSAKISEQWYKPKNIKREQ